MSTFQNNLEQIRNDYAGIFSALDRASKELKVKFVLIGAQCRDVWTRHIEQQRRLTRDVDYAVRIENTTTWKYLRDFLIESEGMEWSSSEPYRFRIHGQVLDIIPFDGVNDEFVFDSTGLVLSVSGMNLITTHSIVKVGGCDVVTVAGLCVLKLISYSEKPDQRSKDYDDFLFLLQNYGKIRGAEIFEYQDFTQLFEEKQDFDDVAATILGREIRAALNNDTKLINTILTSLEMKLGGYSIDELETIVFEESLPKERKKMAEFRSLLQVINELR